MLFYVSSVFAEGYWVQSLFCMIHTTKKKIYVSALIICTLKGHGSWKMYFWLFILQLSIFSIIFCFATHKKKVTTRPFHRDFLNELGEYRWEENVVVKTNQQKIMSSVIQTNIWMRITLHKITKLNKRVTSLASDIPFLNLHTCCRITSFCFEIIRNSELYIESILSDRR